MNPRFSLILATVDRTDPVDRLLESVAGGDYTNVEVVLADQNADDRLNYIVKKFRRRIAVTHLRTPLGLSRARNAALEHATGEIIGFPDDDCEYPNTLLESVATLLTEHPEWGGVVGCPVEIGSGRPLGGFSQRAQDLDIRNVWSLTSSIGLFLRTTLVRSAGKFDETLGAGADTAWGAAEDREYALRAIDRGFVLRYEPRLRIAHPAPEYRDLELARRYGASLGRVLRKRDAGRIEVMRLVFIRPIGGIALSLLHGRWTRARFYFNSLRGRISGWRAPIGPVA